MKTIQKPAIHVSIIGYGDIGRRIAHQLQSSYPANKLTITAFNRQQSAETTETHHTVNGIGHKQLDLDNPSTIDSTVFNNHCVFYLAPPPSTGTEDSRMRHWLAGLEKTQLPKRIVYISTTGVYGDQQGRTVTEQTPVKPQADRAKRRLDAELNLQRFATKNRIEYVILRVSGIYGESRLPVRRLKEQIPMLRSELAPITNRIHQDDLAKICIAAMLQSNSGEVYNVSDGDNINMTDYFIQVARFLKLPLPPEINWQQAEQQLSKGMLSYLKESRLIDNTKLLNTLNIQLTYPSIAEFFRIYSNRLY